MNKKGKKLLALVLALTMSLQWLPALADEPTAAANEAATVTVDEADVTVDAGDQTWVGVNTWDYEIRKDGDIKIEDGKVYMWHADIGNWVLVVDENGNPVSPEGYTETVEHNQIADVTLSGNFVPLEDSKTGEHPEVIETVTVNVGDISTKDENGTNALYVDVYTNESPMDVTVNAESVSVTIENKNEFDAEDTWNSQASAAGVRAYVSQQDEEDATATVTVAGNIEVNVSSENNAASATGVSAGGGEGSISVEAENVNVTAKGETTVVEHTVYNNEGQVVDSFTSTDCTSATGVEAYSSWSTESEPDTEREVTVKDVTVVAESKPVEEGAPSRVVATGVVENSSSADTTSTIETGNVTVTAKDENENGRSDATGIDVTMRSSTGTVTSGDVKADAEGTDTTATGVRVSSYARASYDAEKEEYEYLGPSSATVTAGDVTATSENGRAMGVYTNVENAGSSSTITAGNVTVDAKDGATGVEAHTHGDSKAAATVGDVYAEGSWATGIIAGGTGVETVTAGNVKAVAEDDNGAVAVSVYSNSKESQVSFTVGNVSADGYWATGIDADGTGTETVTAGNVSAEGFYARGISGDAGEGSLTVTAKDVTVTAKGEAEEFHGVWIDEEGQEHQSTWYRTPNAFGVELSGYNRGDEVVASEQNITAGDVTVNAEVSKTEGKEFHSSSNDFGVAVQNLGPEATFTVNVGDVTVNATDKNTDGYIGGVGVKSTVDGATGSITAGDVDVTVDAAQTNATGVDVRSQNGYSEDEKGDSTFNAGEINVTTGDVSVTTGNGFAHGINAVASFSSEATVTAKGDVTVSSETTAGGVYASADRGEAETTVAVEGDVTVKADKNAWGVEAYATGGSVDVETDSVTVEGGAMAIAMQTVSFNNDMADKEGKITSSEVGSVDVTANGDVTATSAEGEATGIIVNAYKDSETDVAVVGDVTATSAEGKATGINVSAYKDSETDVVVAGDVTAEGKEKGVGISVRNDNADVDIVVDGTVSGSANAIEVLTSQTVNGQVQATMDVADTNLTVWAAEENEDSHVAVAVDRNIVPGNEEHPAPTITDTVNEEATKALEASINYIVKIGTDFLQKVTAAGAKGNTVTIGETTYATANEGEDVNVGVTLDSENEVLEGVYYNAEDETTLTKAEDLKKDEQGGFLMKMLRGGAMLLGLKVHTHVYEYKYNNDATCTADGTETAFCSCGKQGDTRTKAGTALGHSFTNYVSDNNATCTADGTKTAKCDRCDATDTVADAGSKREHSFGAPVQENYIEAAPGQDGSYDIVVYCQVCKAEVSRTTVIIPALPVEEKPASTEKAVKYVPVDAEEEVLGVKASEQPAMEEALMTVAENLEESEYSKVTLPAMEEVLDEEQMKVLESLPVQEQLILTLCALGYTENEDQLSADGAGLLQEIKDQITIEQLLSQFPVTIMTINGKECQTFQIEIVVIKDDISNFQRFTFFNDEGTWKLYQVETGVYEDAE